MKLKLCNFRCYEDREFDFGTCGLTLISGTSGKGKTTLMMAIEFALFGTGTKLQNHGKRMCSVELQISDEFVIYRQKGPNRLIVNGVHEDDAGEAIIRQKFGVNMLACYVPQNTRKTFILMSPSERLEFLEALLTSNIDIQQLKTSTKTLIRQYQDQHAQTTGAIHTTKSMLDAIVCPTPVSFPLKCRKEKQSEAMQNEQIRYKNTCIILKRLEKQLVLKQTQLNELDTLNKLIQEWDGQITMYESKLQTLVTPLDYKGNDRLDYLTKTLHKIRANRKLEQMKDEYSRGQAQLQTMKQTELDKLNQALKEIVLWNDGTKAETLDAIKFCKETIDLWTRRENILKEVDSKRTVSDITSEISLLVKQRDDLTSKITTAKLFENTHTCPSCNVQLKFSQNKLILVSDETNSFDGTQSVSVLQLELKKIQEAITRLQKDLDNHKRLSVLVLPEYSKQECEENIAESEAYLNENNAKEIQASKIRDAIAKSKFSSSIVLLEQQLSKLRVSIDSENDLGDYKEIEPLDESELESELLLQTKLHNTTMLIEKQQIETRERIDFVSKTKTTTVKAFETKWGGVVEKYQLEAEIEHIKTQIKDEISKQETHRINLEKIGTYKQYIQDFNRWSTMNEEYKKLIIKEEVLRTKCASVCLFKEKILEAESISISTMIDSINTHAQFYLEHFFPDNPITIRLVPFKEVKDVSKPQINLEIDYKGIEHDITMLSGGELSRVILAFTLALSEMHNTPFVLLDESTSSLDQELTLTVMESLKDQFQDKLVLLIAHQVIQGSFDSVVNLDSA